MRNPGLFESEFLYKSNHLAVFWELCNSYACWGQCYFRFKSVIKISLFCLSFSINFSVSVVLGFCFSCSYSLVVKHLFRRAGLFRQAHNSTLWQNVWALFTLSNNIFRVSPSTPCVVRSCFWNYITTVFYE